MNAITFILKDFYLCLTIYQLDQSLATRTLHQLGTGTCSITAAGNLCFITKAFALPETRAVPNTFTITITHTNNLVSPDKKTVDQAGRDELCLTSRISFCVLTDFVQKQSVGNHPDRTVSRLSRESQSVYGQPPDVDEGSIVLRVQGTAYGSWRYRDNRQKVRRRTI